MYRAAYRPEPLDRRIGGHLSLELYQRTSCRPLDTGAGPVVAAVYGSLWHRWSVPVSDANPDGYAYRLGTISVPSFGAVYS
ncbi:hypothetical protein [Nocardia sp. R7R-8]|uniref:hypothetical protein n=1 Tax=Nocardia sp. R7R-8 TaxID=3459304 RepID=UPI00403E3445